MASFECGEPSSWLKSQLMVAESLLVRQSSFSLTFFLWIVCDCCCCCCCWLFGASLIILDCKWQCVHIFRVEVAWTTGTGTSSTDANGSHCPLRQVQCQWPWHELCMGVLVCLSLCVCLCVLCVFRRVSLCLWFICLFISRCCCCC